MDDGKEGESNSISNQKAILAKYAADNGFTNTQFFVDDGWSGVNFERPAIQELLGEVKAGNISTVIVKDLSRFGRSHVLVGLHTEYTFPEAEVRFIAINDNVDSAKASEGTDISPIKNFFNELQSSETSRKVRASRRAGALQGNAQGKLPYGYIEDERDRRIWLIDEIAAVVIREIFELYVAGMPISDLCRDLSNRGIPTPMKHRTGKSLTDNWNIATVNQLLVDPVYIGRYISQKTTTVSYKNRKRLERPEEEWVIIEDHHPAIVERAVFDAAFRKRSHRQKYTKCGQRSIVSGLVFCKDCGEKMSYFLQGERRDIANFMCKTYRRKDCFNQHQCTRHGIRVETIEKIVLAKIQAAIKLCKTNRKAFEKRVYNTATADSEQLLKSKTAELEKGERRILELDNIISRIYEDNISGKISDTRFTTMLANYEKEQSELRKLGERLRSEMSELKSKTADIQGFIGLVADFDDITELTEKIAWRFVSKIVVHEAIFKEGTKRKKESQEVEVYLNFIGKV
jgi:DNA invertase Pin-like site-specific DNA recombinase